MAPAIRPASQRGEAERRGDGLRLRRLERQRQRAVAQHAGKLLGRLLVELPGDLGGPVDGLVDDGRRDDLAVQHERSLLADVGGGVLTPRRRACGLERQADDPTDSLLSRHGLSRVDLGALDDDGSEHVLLRAVLAAGDQRQRRVVVAAERVVCVAVERLQRHGLHVGVGALPGGPCRVDLGGQRGVGRGGGGRRARGGRGRSRGRRRLRVRWRRGRWRGVLQRRRVCDRGDGALDRGRVPHALRCTRRGRRGLGGRSVGGRGGRPAERAGGPPGVAAGGAAGSAGAAGGGAAGTGPPITSRMRSWAVWPSERAWSPSLPGTVIVRLSPSSTTSAPVTPRPLTRSSMICCACRSCSRGGTAPVSVRGWRVTRVPPCRSMPSRRRGLAVAGEEHQRVEDHDDAGERRQVAPGADPPRG